MSRAQAHPKHGQVDRERLLEPVDLGAKLRGAIGVVDAHRPAHDNGGRDVLDRREDGTGLEDVDDLHRPVAERVEDAVRTLPGDVTEDEDASQRCRDDVEAHAVAPSGRLVGASRAWRVRPSATCVR